MSFKEIMTKEIGKFPFDKSKTIAIPSRFFKKAVLVGTLLTLGFATTIVAEGSKSGATIVRNQEDVSAPTGNGINTITLYGTMSDEAHERRKIRKQREKTEEERKASETEEAEGSKPKPRYLDKIPPKTEQISDDLEDQNVSPPAWGIESSVLGDWEATEDTDALDYIDAEEEPKKKPETEEEKRGTQKRKYGNTILEESRSPLFPLGMDHGQDCETIGIE